MSPIGSTLRAADRKHRLLPDMVVPILPNTQCSSEKRPPIRPNSAFPLPNCFHWIENITKIRVRRRPNGKLFDNSRSIRLNGKQHVALQRAFSDDYDRRVNAPSNSGDDSASSTTGYAPSRTGTHPVIPPDALQDPKVRQACSPLGPPLRPLPSPGSASSSEGFQMSTTSQHDGSPRPRVVRILPTHSESDSDRSGSSSRTDLDEKKQSIVEEISELNLFGWDPDPTFPLIPLVDLWLERSTYRWTTSQVPSTGTRKKSRLCREC